MHAILNKLEKKFNFQLGTNTGEVVESALINARA